MRAIVAFVALALALVACGGSTTTTTTPTTVPAADTSSTVPPTTTSTLPPTTTTALPAAETFVVAGHTCLLGWWDGEWQSTGLPPVRGGEEYQVVRLDEPIGTSMGTEPRPWCEPLDLLNIEFDPALPGEWLDRDAIAVQTTGDVRPHKVELQSTSLPAYIEATSVLLEGRVASVPMVNLTQVIRTDLEGDGVDEVIVAANSMPDDPLATATGDYSILYLRKVVQGEVQTAILEEFIASESGPNNWIRHEVSAIADLNGDGKMEIVVGGPVWEGSFLHVHEYVNDDLGPALVLSCGCGA